MGNINTSRVVNGDLQIPGFRINPKLVVDLETLKKSPNNKLWVEFQESTLRFNTLLQMQSTGEIPPEAQLSFINTKDSS